MTWGIQAAQTRIQVDYLFHSRSPATKCAILLLIGGNYELINHSFYWEVIMKKYLLAAFLAVVAMPAAFAESTQRTIDFGTVEKGNYVTRNLRLTNTEQDPLNVDVRGGNYSFRIGSNCPAVLPRGDTCIVRITFHPTDAGRSYQSYLKITANQNEYNFTLRGWSR